MKKLCTVLLTLSLTLSLVSCGGGLDDPKAFYEEALKKAAEMTSYESAIKLTGKINSVSEKKSISIDTSINNKTDISNKDDIKSELEVNLTLKGNITDANDETISAKFGIKAINKTLYARIDDIKVPENSSMNSYLMILNLIRNKWILVPTEASASDPTSSFTTMLADKENSMFSVINKIFKYKEYKGEKNSLHEIAIELDKNALVNWIESENKKNNKSMTQDEKTAIENSLKSLSIDAIVSIDADKNIKNTSINIKGDNLEDGVSIELNMNSAISNVNSNINIAEPSKNDIIDLNEMFKGFNNPDTDTNTNYPDEIEVNTNTTTGNEINNLPNNQQDNNNQDMLNNMFNTNDNNNSPTENTQPTNNNPPTTTPPALEPAKPN